MILINGLECKAKQTTLPFALLAFSLLFSTLNVNKEIKLKVGPSFDVICKQESFKRKLPLKPGYVKLNYCVTNQKFFLLTKQEN